MPTIYSAKDNSPINLDTFKGIAVVVTVPAAFSGTCTNSCVPSVVENAEKLKAAGASRIIVVSSDQPFAINEWIKAAKWENAAIEFASDFGNFELRAIVGKLGDEAGKGNLPPLLGELLRRSYSVFKDGKVVWQFTEPDTTKYTLKAEDLVEAVRRAQDASL